jgi:hypothetical protein
MTVADDARVGSWTPALLLLLLFIIRWLYASPNEAATRFRRWLGMQKVTWRRKFGLRDNKRYESGAVGHGASRSVKRQG